jgi:predicted aspartyl protease
MGTVAHAIIAAAQNTCVCCRRSHPVGTFHIGCRVENHAERTKSARISQILVDTGSECTWLPARTLQRIGVVREKKDVSFVMANGEVVTRSVGFAILRVEKSFTIDEVVFAEPGDLVLLGARTLEGLNLVVDPRRKKLVAAGPIPAA